MSFFNQTQTNLFKPFRSLGSNENRNASTSNHQSAQSSSTRRNNSWNHPPNKHKPKPLSEISSPAVSDSLWFAQDIQLAASVVIIQPSTGRFVVLSEKRVYKVRGKEEEYERWFLPRGRKDVGESLEQTAVREGYEEVCSSKDLKHVEV
jgi:hypothetical protein